MIKRVFYFVVVAELAYLLVINAALQLPLTQTLVNKIRPEKFQVSWESAWSFYPFRVHARGIAANGQSRTQQWEVYADAGSGSITLLPLVLKHVYLSDVEAENVDYRQRPRLKPDRDYSKRISYFPPITGRDIVPAETQPLKKKRPWKVHISNMKVRGDHRFWIFNLKGSGSGSASGDMYVETRQGNFWLDVENVALNLGPAYLNENAEIYSGGTVTGDLGFAPLNRRENRGRRMLPYGYLDAQLDLDVDSFDFIKVFTAGLGDLDISGAGEVSGRVAIRDGHVRAGTQLKATAANLGVAIRGIDIDGQGTVLIHTPTDADKPMQLDVRYDALTAFRAGEDTPFLEGNMLKLNYSGSNFIIPDPDLSFKDLWNDERARQRRAGNSFNLSVDNATLLDMATFNYYLPPETAFSLMGGTTRLDADVFFSEDDMDGAIELDSSGVKIEFDDQVFQGDLDADINIAGGVPRELKADLSGSTLRLFNLYVMGKKAQFDGDYWSAGLKLTDAQGAFPRPIDLSAKAELSVSDTRPLVAFIDNRNNPPKWISNLVAVKDLAGEAQIQLSQGRLTIPHAFVGSEKAEVAVKAEFYRGERTGVAYARYKKVDGLLKRIDGKRKVDLLKSREKFDAYRLPD